MHIHKLDPNQHAALFNESRRDSITGELLQPGDQVVFCAACHSVFSEDSWQYINKRHCGQSRTLSYVPTPRRELSLRKSTPTHRSLYKKEKRQDESRLYLVASVSVALMLVALLVYGGYRGYEHIRYRVFEQHSSYSLQTNFAFEQRLMKRGDYYLAVERYQEAIEQYERILDYNENYAPAESRIHSIQSSFHRTVSLAGEHFERQNYQEARQYFYEALRYDPENEEVLQRLDQIAVIQSEPPQTTLLVGKHRKAFLNLQNQYYAIRAFANESWCMTPAAVYPSHSAALTALDTKGQLQASARGKNIEVRNLEDGKRRLQMHFKYPVYRLSLSQDGNELAVVTTEGVVKVIDVRRREVIKNLLGSKTAEVAWLPNNDPREKHLAVTGTKNTIYVYKMQPNSSREIRDFRVIEYPQGHRAILSPDGRYFATYDESSILRVYSMQTDDLVRTFRPEKGHALSGVPRFSMDSQFLIARQQPTENSAFQQVMIWRL